MTKGNVLKHLLIFSIPIFIGNFFQLLYSISDLIIVVRMIGVEAFAAIGAIMPLLVVIMFVIIGLANGFSIITGQRFGAKDYSGVKNSFIVSLFLITVITLFFTIICLIFIHPILNFMNIPSNIYHNAFLYAEIIITGLLVTAIYNLLASIIKALGDSKTPLYFLIFGLILNIVLAIFFIGTLHWGIIGSAIAVIISQLSSVILCLILISKKFKIIRLQKKDFNINNKDFITSIKEHLKIGLPMSFQFSLIGISILIIQAICNSFGSDVIAAFTAALRIEQLATIPLISIAVALSTYVAQNYGANNIKRIQLGVSKCSLINIFFAIFAAVIMRFWGADIVGLFIGTNSPEIINIAKAYLIISTLFYFFLGQMFIYRNTLQSMGKVIYPFIACLLELVARASVAIFLASKIGYTGIFYAGPVAWLSAATVVFFGYLLWIKSTNKTKNN